MNRSPIQNVVLVSVIVLGSASFCFAETFSIRRQRDSRTTIEVAGLAEANLKTLSQRKQGSDKWVALLALYVQGSDKKREKYPVLGSYFIKGKTLCFESRFPLSPSVKYRAVFDPAQLPHPPKKVARVTTEIALPKPKPSPPTVVKQIYPTQRTLPENQLKFYVHFSASMTRGESYKNIRLLNQKGQVISDPFLELFEELWDPSLRRFTLLIDPGRIKRGLKPREDVGPVLEQDKSYTLVIDRNWRDAEGRKLKETFRKKFRVGAPDEKQPSPKTWKLNQPRAATTNALRVSFGEPLDHAMLQRVLWVENTAGQPIKGTIRVENHETRWLFTPKKPWQAGKYVLVAETTLEDLAGNNIARPFEVDLFDKITKRVEVKTAKVPFVVR